MHTEALAEADAPYQKGLQALSEGNDALAEQCFRETLAQHPDHTAAVVNLAYVLNKRGLLSEAENHLWHAVQLAPQCAEAFLNLGALLTMSKRYKEAEEICTKAILLQAQSPQSWSNLGVLYARLKREAEAEQCHRTAMGLSADHAMSRFNLSYLLLRQGRYEEGWQCLEARQWYSSIESALSCPRWRGESLTGKSLLITYEAGHGDMIHFIRYANVLRQQQPMTIDLVCHPALKSLFSEQQDIDHVFALDEALPTKGWDFWAPPLSLPFHCKTRLDTIPNRIPYLFASREKIAAWAPKLPNDGPRVGLVWKGNPSFENDADRSLPSLNTLVPLGKIGHLRFISLQKGAGEEEAASDLSGDMRISTLGPQLRDFADTAAVISQLNLVISVDTAVAHLAAALGVPCWILLPAHLTDWRWLKDRSDSPWYPGVVRLFRQKTEGNWDSVVNDLHASLTLTFPANGG